MIKKSLVYLVFEERSHTYLYQSREFLLLQRNSETILIWIYVWGPARVRTLKHAKYSLTLLDNATYWADSHLMVHKSNAFIKFVNHHTYITTNFGVISKILQCDRDRSFLSDKFHEYMSNNGIKYKLTVHDTLEHNRVAKCMHLTLSNGVHILLITSRLPTWLWGYALMHATFIYNNMFTVVKAQNQHIKLPF